MRTVPQLIKNTRCRLGQKGTDFHGTRVAFGCREILGLRAERAKLLGFRHHGELSCASKMASFEEAVELVERLQRASLGPAMAEIFELSQFAEQNGQYHHPRRHPKHWCIRCCGVAVLRFTTASSVSVPICLGHVLPPVLRTSRARGRADAVG